MGRKDELRVGVTLRSNLEYSLELYNCYVYFYMSPIISLIWGLILTVNALREGFQKNVKLGLLAEPPLTPPPLLTWAPLLGKIVVLSRF